MGSCGPLQVVLPFWTDVLPNDWIAPCGGVSAWHWVSFRVWHLWQHPSGSRRGLGAVGGSSVYQNMHFHSNCLKWLQTLKHFHLERNCIAMNHVGLCKIQIGGGGGGAVCRWLGAAMAKHSSSSYAQPLASNLLWPLPTPKRAMWNTSHGFAKDNMAFV